MAWGFLIFWFFITLAFWVLIFLTTIALPWWIFLYQTAKRKEKIDQK